MRPPRRWDVWKLTRHDLNGRHPQSLATYAADDARITMSLWARFNTDHEARRRRVLRLIVLAIMIVAFALACYAAWEMP